MHDDLDTLGIEPPDVFVEVFLAIVWFSAAIMRRRSDIRVDKHPGPILQYTIGVNLDRIRPQVCAPVLIASSDHFIDLRPECAREPTNR